MFCGVEVDVEASAAVVDEDYAVVGGVFVCFCNFREVLDAVGEVGCDGLVEVLWVLWDGLVVDGGGWFEVVTIPIGRIVSALGSVARMVLSL